MNEAVSGVEGVIAEAVEAARVRADAAQKSNEAAAASGGFKSSELSAAVVEKFIREELDARRDALVDAAVAQANAEF